MIVLLHFKKNIRSFAFLTAVLLSGVYQIKAQSVLSTIAGNGTGSSTGDAGLATAATVNQPTFLALDATGDLYLGESNRIRKINLTTGIISTYLSGLSSVRGIAFYGGALYFAEGGTNGHTVKKYTGTGSATIVAGIAATPSTVATAANGDGGLATAATLNTPSGIAIDVNGNLFIADRSNHRIRMVNVSATTDGIIKTILGDGNTGTGLAAANGIPGVASGVKVSFPNDLKFDAAGNLYVASSSNSCVLKIESPAANGNVSVVAGTYGLGGNTGNGGLAISARLNSPYGLVFDNAGVMYILENGSINCVKYVLPSGIIDYYAGQPGAGTYGGDGGSPTAASTTAYFNFNAPCAGVFDALGNLYLGDRGNHRIRKITPPLIPLPVKLTSFTAQKNNQQVALNWQTSSEINTSHFNVQRSFDGTLFTDVLKVTAYGNSNTSKNYSAIDALQNIDTKKVFYRLKLVDKSGSFTYSDIRFVSFSNDKRMATAYPNPITGNSFTIDLGYNPQKPTTYSITNFEGKTIQTGNISVVQEVIQLNDIKSGTYLIKLQDGQSIKLVK